MYIASVFILAACIIAGVAAARLRHAAKTGVMPPAPNDASGACAYPSIPALNGVGECASK